MDSRFLGQSVIVTTESEEPQCGTIVGETPMLFAVRTETGDVMMVEKRYTYPYDAATFQRVKETHDKFSEAKTSLETAWANIMPLVDMTLAFVPILSPPLSIRSKMSDRFMICQ